MVFILCLSQFNNNKKYKEGFSQMDKFVYYKDNKHYSNLIDEFRIN